MRRLRATAALLLLASLAACTSETPYGECYGLLDKEEVYDPNLRYETDAGNIVLAVIFSETIIVPIWVVAEEVRCPVGRRALPQPAIGPDTAAEVPR